MPHCVQQQGWVGAGCPQDSWSWSIAASQYSLATQRIQQISGPGFGATPREGWSWCYWGPGALCCPEGILEPHSFVLGAASPLPTFPATSPALGPHPRSHFPPLYREATIPGSLLPPLKAAHSVWSRTAGAPSQDGRAGPPLRQRPQLLFSQPHCCLLLCFALYRVCSLAPFQMYLAIVYSKGYLYSGGVE